MTRSLLLRRMTREEILAMKPGREMDAVVAANAMGLTVMRQQEPDHFLHGLAKALRVPKHERAAIPMVQMWRTSDGKTLRRYSTGTAASDVVEEMLTNAWDFQLVHRRNATGYCWGASFSRGAFELVWCPTASEAICKAALLALLEEADAT